MNLAKLIKSVVELVDEAEDKLAIVRLAEWENKWIASVEVHSSDFDADILGYQEEVDKLGLDGEDKELVQEILDLARGVVTRGEIYETQGMGTSPEEAVTQLHERLILLYKEVHMSIAHSVGLLN